MSMRWPTTTKALRWDLVLVVSVALIFGVVSTTSSAYFMHIDTPTQDGAALEWARGCWEWSTEKMLPVVLLGILFRLFGPSPYWETALLLIGQAVTVALVYELTRLITKSKLAGVLAALTVSALPAYQYFSRTYLGYHIPFLLLAWLAIYRHRWGWAGVLFGLAVTAHFASIVLIGFSVVTLAALHWRTISGTDWFRFGITHLLPLLAVDAIFFVYTGRPFLWSLGIVSNLQRLSGPTQSNWLWLGQSVVGSNGWILSALLAMGAIAPLVLKRDKVGAVLGLVTLGSTAFYAIQAGLGRGVVLSKILVSLYPLWAVLAGAVLLKLLWTVPHLGTRRIATVMLVLVLSVLGIRTGRFIREFTETLHPQVEEWIVQASDERLPIRHIGGIMWTPLFFARIHGVEIVVGDGIPADQRTLDQPVVLFEGSAPTTLERDGYSITVAELHIQTKYPILEQDASIPRRYELWWSDQKSGTVRPEILEGAPPIYYSGSGCITAPWYGYGTMHFYQLVWHKATSWVGLE